MWLLLGPHVPLPLESASCCCQVRPRSRPTSSAFGTTSARLRACPHLAQKSIVFENVRRKLGPPPPKLDWILAMFDLKWTELGKSRPALRAPARSRTGSIPGQLWSELAEFGVGQIWSTPDQVWLISAALAPSFVKFGTSSTDFGRCQPKNRSGFGKILAMSTESGPTGAAAELD